MPNTTKKPPTRQKAGPPKQPRHAAAEAQRELTQIQELALDAIADLFWNGGECGDFNDLVHIARSHRTRMTFRQFSLDQEEIDKRVKKDLDEDLDTWKADIRKLHRRRPIDGKAAATPKTVTEKIRVNYRVNLRREFTDFLHAATPEEIYLLSETLIAWRSVRARPDLPQAEMILAAAFEEQIEYKRSYLKIPRRHIELVEKYALMLQEAEDKAAA